MIRNLTSQDFAKDDTVDWPLFFGAALWSLWIMQRVEDESSPKLLLLPRPADTSAWLPPNVGWCKINTDGTQCSSIRPADGILQVRSVLDAEPELWGIAYRRVCAELDHPGAANPLLEGTESSSFGAAYCSRLGESNWDVSFLRANRASNKVADGLPKLGRAHSFGLQIFASPPDAIVELDRKIN
ncbi:hypothetical protein V6N13_016820 [Hibiscus sabdariffa]|uniref:Uncharacterized protein n=1 Tax=Hibiscus sabdariffa TaxID=183260 RepID=A0ABR2PU58_9ROSI